MSKIDLSKPLEIVRMVSTKQGTITPTPVEIVYTNLSWVTVTAKGEENSLPVTFSLIHLQTSIGFSQYALRNREPSLEEKAEEVALGWYKEYLSRPITVRRLPAQSNPSSAQGVLYELALKLLKEGTIK